MGQSGPRQDRSFRFRTVRELARSPLVSGCVRTWMALRLNKCVSGGSATAVEPGSIIVDEANDYIEWKVNITLPINVADEKCMESFAEAGANFVRLGRQNVTAVLKFSMVR